MIELIPMEAEKVIGLRVDGKIEKPDIKAIEQAVEPKFAQFDRISIYVEVADLGGIALDALVEDLKFAFANLSHFEKKAVVSEHQWMDTLATFGDKLFPSLQVQHFGFDEKDTAIAWVSQS